MALQIHQHTSSPLSSFFYSQKLLHCRSPTPAHFHRTNLSVRFQDTSSSSSPSSSSAAADNDNSTAGTGFGSSSSEKKKPKTTDARTKRVIRRRAPLEQPGQPIPPGPEPGSINQEQGRNESAFLLTWLGLGVVILAQGLTLSASGFLPEEWDKFIVKYVYPTFTPTVGFFVAGTVAYGVLKYLQNDQLNKK